MRKSKPYAAVPVNRVLVEQLSKGRAGKEVVVGLDIGKYEILAVPRWGPADFGRPWRIHNPQQIPEVVRLVVSLGQGRRLRVALEPSGTYGDALRQAVHDVGIQVPRVSPKAAHDYSERVRGATRHFALSCPLTGVGQGNTATSTIWPCYSRASAIVIEMAVCDPH
jgi:hypothetical protein